MVQSSPSRLTSVETNVDLGVGLDVEEVGGLRRWPSRSALPVVTLAASMRELDREAAGLAVSTRAVP